MPPKQPTLGGVLALRRFIREERKYTFSFRIENLGGQPVDETMRHDTLLVNVRLVADHDPRLRLTLKRVGFNTEEDRWEGGRDEVKWSLTKGFGFSIVAEPSKTPFSKFVEDCRETLMWYACLGTPAPKLADRIRFWLAPEKFLAERFSPVYTQSPP